MGGIEHVARRVMADLEAKLPRQRKTQRGKLGLLVFEHASGAQRQPDGLGGVSAATVRADFGAPSLARLARRGARVVVKIDQSKASDRHQMVMVSARVGGRALPLAWRVKETQGAIGFAGQL